MNLYTTRADDRVTALTGALEDSDLGVRQLATNELTRIRAVMNAGRTQ